MLDDIVRAEIREVVAVHGTYPLRFFSILDSSGSPSLDFETRNAEYDYIRAETWHSLDLSDYRLWAYSDNADLLWWNGDQTILMDYRGSAFISIGVRPSQFIRLVAMGKYASFFPQDLLDP
ncbi:MAG: hypothetical protein AAGF99_05890 [Bacteroidota bacterium]